MNIHAPEEVSAAAAPKTDVIVNVFAGSPRSTVEIKLGESGSCSPMKPARIRDPYFDAMKKLEGPTPPPGRKLPAGKASRHIWKAPLATEATSPGTNLIHVRTTDMYGKTYEDRRLIRITAEAPKVAVETRP